MRRPSTLHHTTIVQRPVLSSPSVTSFAELSCSPLFRQQWSSLYEALQDSRPQRRKLMRLYIEQMRQGERPVLAGDHTIWARPYATTLQERTYEHQVAMLGNRPVGVGQGWSTLAWIPESGTSWALPLRHERITSFESSISKAAWQLQQVCQVLSIRAISLWDSEYGCARFVLATADITCDKLMRLRSNRCFWTTPPTYSGRGRPRVHGDKFKLSDPATWHCPDQQSEVDDPKQGRLRLRCWQGMHFRRLYSFLCKRSK
ncbi:transposase [Trichocoleus sp. FACHB-262]|nr:transposase [Trichocoleus sp. FACHB-262]